MNKKWIALTLAALVFATAASACGTLDNVARDIDNALDDAMRQDEDVFPDSLARADADVTVDDLISTLGRKKTELTDAMKNVDTVGDAGSGMRTYRHKLLGHTSEVSYAFGDTDRIDRIVITTDLKNADDWEKELWDTLRASAVTGETGTWRYGGSTLRMETRNGKQIITIEKTA